MKSFVVTGVCAVVFASVAYAGNQQDLASISRTKIGAWTLTCSPATAPKECAVVQGLKAEDDTTLTIVFSPAEDRQSLKLDLKASNKGGRLQVDGPNEISGLPISFDGYQKGLVRMQDCEAGFCHGTVRFDGDFASEFMNAKEVTVGVPAADRHSGWGMDLDLKGIGPALQTMKTTLNLKF